MHKKTGGERLQDSTKRLQVRRVFPTLQRDTDQCLQQMEEDIREPPLPHLTFCCSGKWEVSFNSDGADKVTFLDTLIQAIKAFKD